MLKVSISVSQKNADPEGGAVPPYADIEHKDISYINRWSLNEKGRASNSSVQPAWTGSRTASAITCERSSRV